MGKLNFFFQAENGIRDIGVTGVQTCALPILRNFAVLKFTEGSLESKVVSQYHSRRQNQNVLKPISQTPQIFTNFANFLILIKSLSIAHFTHCSNIQVDCYAETPWCFLPIRMPILLTNFQQKHKYLTLSTKASFCYRLAIIYFEKFPSSTWISAQFGFLGTHLESLVTCFKR